MGQLEAKLRAIEGLHTQSLLNLIKAHEQAKGVLPPEQRQKLERLHHRLPVLRRLTLTVELEEPDIMLRTPQPP